ncbi:hypothetical protein NHX12_032258 [Muraenolepis orangiensis]|uniref:Protein CYR61-like n=1 Tax=Muraenolepis orangiensis TaxID=630683 RepID=A0A9Q0ILC9_9TELE|nr:hypothetical protein NHX12_032258 [Muraenolepis orangiensis]
MGTVIFLAALQMLTVGLCPAAGWPSCPPGVSLVPDGCGCCKVCAAQLNQDCHEGRPCDHHKGLECNYGNDVGRTHGICRVQRPHLPERHVPLASPACPAPRLVKVPGQCCLTVDCHKTSTSSSTNTAVGAPASYPPLFPFVPYPSKPYPYPGKPYTKSKPYLSKPYPSKPYPTWPCSRSCGVGVSSRVTNDNAKCKLVKETRLCNIRPCSSMSMPVKKGRKCSRTHKAPEPHRLSYAGCRTTRLYRPNYCGVCRDGRCCSPRRTRTATVTFACADGERFDRAVMFVQSCKCSDECNHLNEAAMSPQRWLYGDTHKFLD